MNEARAERRGVVGVRAPEGRAAKRLGREAARTLPCRLAVHPWAEFFGLRRDVAATEKGRRRLCRRVTDMIPSAARRGYVIERVVNRGAYGIVFVARKDQSSSPLHQPSRVALKMQFVCPKKLPRGERKRCGGYGQRASLYETVRYEARTHTALYETARAAGVMESGAGEQGVAQKGGKRGAKHVNVPRLFSLPRVPQPVTASRLILGKKGEFPGVPPDGRRRLWVSLMEFIPHPSLRMAVIEARDRGVLTASNFLALVGGVARHLAGMHAVYGYAHGDAHSGNFLVDLDAAGRRDIASWVYVIDLERSIPRSFLQLAPNLGSVARRKQLWTALRTWDLKVFCESAASLAETARIWDSEDGTASEGTPSGAKEFEGTPSGAKEFGASAGAGEGSGSLGREATRLRRGMLVAQVIVDAYAQGYAAAAKEMTGREMVVCEEEEEGAEGDVKPVGVPSNSFASLGVPSNSFASLGVPSLLCHIPPTSLLLAWVARAFYLKNKPEGTIPSELIEGEAGEPGPLAGIDVRGIDRRAHRDFFTILRAAQSLSLAVTNPRPRSRGH